MQFTRAVIAVVTLLAASTVAAASAEAPHRGCAVPRGAAVVAKTRYAVVYAQDAEHKYGCLFSRGRRALLFDAESPLLLAGRYVAYEQVSYDPDSTVYYLLTVFDLRRRTAHSFSSLYEEQPPGPNSRESQDPGMAKDLVLKKNGSVAWISCWRFPPGPGGCAIDADTPVEVWRTDSRGTKLLDASTEVRLRSLKRQGSTITWRHGSERRSAQLK